MPRHNNQVDILHSCAVGLVGKESQYSPHVGKCLAIFGRNHLRFDFELPRNSDVSHFD